MIEPMIKPTFVIVILGILASVAIPRLAGTKADAEISAAVANLRTLVSDASAYHVVKGDFTNAKWNDITNVPLKNATTNTAGNAVGTAATANLKVGGKDCIGVHLVNKNGDTPTYIKFTQNDTNKNSGTCKQVLESDPIKPYFSSTVAGVTGLTAGTSGAMAIGSSTSIYTTTATQAAVASATTTVAATAATAATAVAQAAAAAKPAAQATAARPAVARPQANNNGKGKAKGKSKPPQKINK